MLHIGITNNIGGIEMLLFNVYKFMDREKIQFDFITTANRAALDNQIQLMGCKIYKISQPLYIFNYYKQLKKLLKLNEYNIVHIHKNSAVNIIPLIICKSLGINFIVHSHNTAPTVSGMLCKVIHYLNRFVLLRLKFHAFACSEIAAKWLYGQKYLDMHDVIVLKNGIDVKKFMFNRVIRDKVRSRLGIENNFVIGNVGKLEKQKNHIFLLEVFSSILKLKPNAILLICGIGSMEKELKEKASLLGIKERVLFLGRRTDINEIMQAMDVFVFPSIYEGLPIAAIESQAAGLPTFMSDQISSETKVSQLVSFLSLDRKKEEWAEVIVDSMKNFKRSNMSDVIIKNGYNIEITAKFLEDFYINNT